MKLLLHMCCAPCSVHPAEKLISEGHTVEGLFFNPNIHPVDEFIRRRDNVIKFSAIKGIKVRYEDDFRQKEWEGFTGQPADRCAMCYGIRLEQAARTAALEGFDAFTTSLLVSPYQKHDLIRELGERYAQEYGVKFFYADFRPGFREGQQKAKEMGLYRQKYCGCIVSFTEASERLKGKR